MSTFHISKEAKHWFADSFKAPGPLKQDFDKYYLCLLLGFRKTKRVAVVGESSGFIKYWIQDYDGVKELLLGLLLNSELKFRDVGLDEKKAVQDLCSQLFTQQDSTSLTLAGMSVLDRIAQGGFEFLAESFPNDHPRTQHELLTHVAELLLAD